MNSPENRDAQGRLTRVVTKQGKGVMICRLWKANKTGERVYANNWTRQVKRNGRRYYFTLPADRAKAEQMANELDAFLQVKSNTIEQAMQKFCPDKVASKLVSDTVATANDVITVFKKKAAVLDVKHSSARRYTNVFLRVIAVVRAYRSHTRVHLGKRMKPEQRESAGAFSLAELTPEFFSDFKSAILRGVTGDEALKKQRKRTANSYLRNMMALFTEPAMRMYRAAGYNVPKISEEGAEPFRKVDKRYKLPEMSVIRAVFELGRDLRNGSDETAADPNGYIAYLLALHGGLRKEEIAHCRWSWFSENQPWRISIQADGTFDPKGTEGETEIEDWVHQELEQFGDEDYLLKGNWTETHDDVFRRLNQRLRASGLNRFKPTHELRKLFGSYIATTRNLFVAQKMLRHKSAQLTSDDYADNIMDETVVQLWTKAA